MWRVMLKDRSDCTVVNVHAKVAQESYRNDRR